MPTRRVALGPTTSYMTVAQAEREFDAANEQDNFIESPSMVLERIKNQISWLEYVADHEYSDSERQRLYVAARKFYMTIRTMTAKYID